jgi:predicted dehydrogenase
VRRRPLPGAAAGLSATAAGGEFGEVTVDDAALFLGRMDGGAIATYEATRFATGRKNAIRVEVNGSAGSLAFDLERLNELEFLDGTRAGMPSCRASAGWW